MCDEIAGQVGLGKDGSIEILTTFRNDYDTKLVWNIDWCDNNGDFSYIISLTDQQVDLDDIEDGIILGSFETNDAIELRMQAAELIRKNIPELNENDIDTLKELLHQAWIPPKESKILFEMARLKAMMTGDESWD